jgi:adenylosuccinate synthase
MRRAVITVGLGFGDEGKGATVDFLARALGADLLVRYCGGSQAGHNVQLPDGRRHTFSQFGAGTLAPHRPRSYLGPNVVVDPPALRREADHLAELGVPHPTRLLTVHPHCLVTTHWHRALNRLRELARGADRHGSCGLGIGEARSYWLRHGQDAPCAADLRDPNALRAKLELQRQRALLELQGFLDALPGGVLAEFDLWGSSAQAEAEHLSASVAEGVTIGAEMPPCSTALFEGAQGVLLDEYRGFHPHTTWSTVTAHHAWELIEQMGTDAVAVLGVTRAYTTRHGEGPLPTFSADLTAGLRDPGNPHNPWQGGLRCGRLDLPLLRYAVAAAGPLDGLVVNHLDQITASEGWFCNSYQGDPPSLAQAPDLGWQARLTEQLRRAEPVLAPATAEEIVGALGTLAPVVLTAHGPTHEHRQLRDLVFRTRRDSEESPSARL